MKRKYLAGLLALALSGGLALGANAQEKTKEKKSGVEKGAAKVGSAIGKAANAVGKKTSEVAVKGASKVADKTWKGKMAPDGSNVYIDSKNKKYYIDKKGAKIYLKASQIKDRPKGM